METNIIGIVLGYAVLNKQLVLFTHLPGGNDYIYKITQNDVGLYEIEIVIEGLLGFQLDSYFETLPVYENENVQKVYWVDGVNQPRFVNIADKYVSTAEGINKINFIPLLHLKEKVSIIKNESAGGSFPSGTVQYAMTYYNVNGTQSNIFYISDLFYAALSGLGGAANVITNNVFDITITDVDKSFDYIRIYSIVRSSENGTPVVKRVTDIKIGQDDSYSYVDNNLGGSIEDISVLMYAGGTSIIPKTIEQKDNVLFLGNYEFKNKPISQEIKESLRNNIQVSSRYKTIHTDTNTGQYPYENQLKFSAKDITYLKYLETYRFGVQFQDNTGSWSEAVWLSDYRQTNKPLMGNPISTNNLDIRVSDFILQPSLAVLNTLNLNGWVRMRPLIVYPKPEEREIVAQGILCPTVYNVEDRYTNSPFAQSSWFSRPNIPFDILYTKKEVDSRLPQAKALILNELYQRAYNYSLPESVPDDWPYRTPVPSPFLKSSVFNGMKWAEFRHDCPIPDNRFENAEIQNITKPNGVFIDPDTNIQEFINNNKQFYYIDQGLVTFHSPELEYEKEAHSNLSNYKLRIVGSAGLTGSSFNKNIETNTPTLSEVLASMVDDNNMTDYFNSYGEYEYNTTKNNISLDGYMGFISLPLWLDRMSGYGFRYNADFDEDKFKLTSFIVYPWHRQSSLGDQTSAEATGREGWEPIYLLMNSNLDNKQLLNFRFSGYSEYFDIANIWDDNNTFHNGVSDIQLFNSTENTGIKLKAPVNSGINDLVYYGNIDKITSTLSGGGYFLTYGKREAGSSKDLDLGLNWLSDDYKWSETQLVGEDYGSSGLAKDPIRIQYKSSPHAVIALNYSTDGKQSVLPTHYHIQSDIERRDSVSVFTTFQTGRLRGVNPVCFQPPKTKRFWEDDISIYKGYSGDAATILYAGEEKPKINVGDDYSSYRWMNRTHFNVTDLWYNLGNPTSDLLRYNMGLWVNFPKAPNSIYSYKDEYAITRHFNNDNDYLTPDISVNQAVLPVNHDFGYFWIGEIYNDNVTNRFGGTSESALYQNEWYVAGDTVGLSEPLVYSRGDTFIQRYDHLKTYTSNPVAPNSVTDIVSFFCETHVNIDGRTDRNRGNINNLAITPELMNLFNPVYNQKDNLFTYHTLDSTKFNLNIFSNSITWTKKKIFGEEIDSWTNINVVDNIDLDGEKGPLRTITKYNNELFAFQDEGIANILYNSRTQIPSTEFSNIIIGNSGVVDGKVYIAQFGTNNRGSIKSTPNGIYFIDGLTNGIYKFDSQGIKCISDELGFRDWVGDTVNNTEWTVSKFGNFVTHYDESTDDVYFVNKEYCLNYSEYLNQFSSFLSYENTPHMFNLNGEFYSILNTSDNNSVLFKNFTGEYNMFYKNITNINSPIYEPFYVTVVANNELTYDKIFTNVDFKADFFDNYSNTYLPQETYDTLNIWTEYQDGSISLTDSFDFKSSLKKKFNRWRANIPRDRTHNRQRIRNNWAFIKLSKQGINRYRSELHELLIYYYS